jgi:hypothetical protein
VAAAPEVPPHKLKEIKLVLLLLYFLLFFSLASYPGNSIPLNRFSE